MINTDNNLDYLKSFLGSPLYNENKDESCIGVGMIIYIKP